MRTLILICSTIFIASALKCYKDASTSEDHTNDKKEVECVCGDYCVKYFADDTVAGNREVKQKEDAKKIENDSHVMVTKTKTREHRGAQAASWDCGCSRTGGFQADMCKEAGRGVFGEDPTLKVDCCEGNLCNHGSSLQYRFSIIASVLALFVFYLSK